MTAGEESHNCPDLSTGHNCTETWKESLDPGATIVLLVLLSSFAICSCVLVPLTFRQFIEYVTRLMNGEDDHHISHKRNFKNKAVRSAAVSSVFFTIFYACDANLTYQIDVIYGKLAIHSLLIAMVFAIQSNNYLLIMYVDVLNSSIIKRSSLFARVTPKLLQWNVVPWGLHCVNIVLSFLIGFEVLDSVILAVRISWGVAAFQVLAVSNASYYYMNKLAVLIETVNADSDANQYRSDDDSDNWKHVGRHTKLLSLHLFVSGNISGACLLGFAATEITQFPLSYFIIQSFFATYTAVFFILALILLYGRRGYLKSSRRKQTTLRSSVKVALYADGKKPSATSRLDSTGSMHLSKFTSHDSVGESV